MKVLSASQLYQAHKLTIKNQEITELDLLERAGVQVFNWIHARMQGSQVKIHVFNGIGNNGGVGLILGRHLIQHGYNVNNYVVNFSKKRTDCFLKSYENVKAMKSWPTLINNVEDFPTDIHPDDIIVDAIFGIGLNREPNELVYNLFSHLNVLDAFKLAIDIPSGLYAEQAPEHLEQVLHVNYTLSFQSPKMVFFLPDTGKFTEQWEILDIGLDQEYMRTVEAPQLINKHEVLPMYKKREKYADKFSYGHSLIIGGSYGKMGSVQLASKASLVSGCGLTTAYIPKCGYIPLQTSLPEAMVQTDEDDKEITKINTEGKFNAIGLGIGLGTSKNTEKAVLNFLKSNNTPLVIDADALNILAENQEIFLELPVQTILTPHKKELERLIGKWSSDFDMLAKSKVFSTKYDCILVIKGANTLTVYKERVFINTTGNTALATAGSGDVLTGIITGLLAQDYPNLNAAIFGVYLHGKTADIALVDTGYQSFIASDSIDYLAEAYLDLFAQPKDTVTDEKENKE